MPLSYPTQWQGIWGYLSINSLLSSVEGGCCWALFWVMEHFCHFILIEPCLSWSIVLSQ